MKKGIHPPCGTITVIKTDGQTFETKSCLSMKYSQYYLEMDPESHPAWSKQNRFSGPSVGNVRKFEKQYPGLENLK